MMRFVVIAAVLCVAAPAIAAPPPGTDMSSPTAEWFEGLKRPDTGTSCCDVSDCRSVEYHETGNPDFPYEALVLSGGDDREHFPWARHDAWVQIPKAKVLHTRNPTGRAQLCWMPALGPLCFVKGAES